MEWLWWWKQKLMWPFDSGRLRRDQSPGNRTWTSVRSWINLAMASASIPCRWKSIWSLFFRPPFAGKWNSTGAVFKFILNFLKSMSQLHLNFLDRSSNTVYRLETWDQNLRLQYTRIFCHWPAWKRRKPPRSRPKRNRDSFVRGTRTGTSWPRCEIRHTPA